ncbi:MAG TPA: protein kinase, partial [Ktedonobacterales bacterium]|nr:protein kinase [Ktedonobacterales bacterium]
MELEVLGDRYELQEPIGRGGMATIYRAVDLRMGRTVAAKILREVYSTDPKFVTRFQREARAASALQHPNIVQVFDYGQSGESYYIVMEFVDGADLRRYLKKNGQLDNDRAIEIAHDVALGLGAAHKRGIVHRDVKPQNIMLNDDGLVKLTDFGIASMYKDAEAERLTTTGMTLGTVQYYAPEQAQGEVVSPPADIYALGIVMYEMLAGRTPFDGDTPVAIAMRHIQDAPDPPSMYNPRIAPGLERIILRCLEKDPRDRFRDGDALAYALENLARAPRHASGAVGAPAGGRSQFAPLALPSTDGRPNAADGRPGGPGAFGGPALPSGPGRGGRPTSQPFSERAGMGYGGDFGPGGGAPVYNDFDRNGVTRPNGPAIGTVPRSPTPGRTSGPYGVPERPANGKRNGPIVATVVISAVLLLGLGCFLTLSMTGALKGLTGA